MDNNKRLFEWSDRRGITDTDLSLQLGIDRTYISKMRRGHRFVNQAMAWRFAQAYGYDVADALFQFEKEIA